jgi:ribosomal protein S18 acetylase RimI-like enzyme
MTSDSHNTISGNETLLTRLMKPDDCDAAVSIHIRSFQGFFLTFLGPNFLSLLYRSIVSDSSGVAFVVEEKNKIVGFVVGSTQPSGLYKRLLKKHLVAFFLSSVGAFLRKPAIFPRLIRAFTISGQQLPAENCATLMSIAVDPTCQGKGIGKLLVKAFLSEAQLRGSHYVNLTTDVVNNESANIFYQSLGFELFRNFTTMEGRIMNEYLFKLR